MQVSSHKGARDDSAIRLSYHTISLIRQIIDIWETFPVNASRYGKKKLRALNSQFNEVKGMVLDLSRKQAIPKGLHKRFFRRVRKMSKISSWLIQQGSLDPYRSLTLGRYC